jgi:hypothetical protein
VLGPLVPQHVGGEVEGQHLTRLATQA